MKYLAAFLIPFDVGMAFFGLPQFRDLFLGCACLAVIGAVVNHFHELDLKDRNK